MKRIPLMALLLLAACASPETIAQRKAQQVEDDRKSCVSYGLQPASAEFERCLSQLELARQQERFRYGATPYRPQLDPSLYRR